MNQIIPLAIPVFFAGVLTFLAPCTLPLVPGYLAFISNVSRADLANETGRKKAKLKIFLNGFFYVLGFSVVFVVLGSVAGLSGSLLIRYRLWLSRLGGLFVIFFGLFMLGITRLPFFDFLTRERRFNFVQRIKPGTPSSSLIFGAAFAFGWVPCIGPILGSILTLAAISATAGEGAVLLAIFSLGLAVPFLIIAFGISSASRYLLKLDKYLRLVSVIGGLFLVFTGFLLLTNQFGYWITLFYQVFKFIQYDKLLDYL